MLLIVDWGPCINYFVILELNEVYFNEIRYRLRCIWKHTNTFLTSIIRFKIRRQIRGPIVNPRIPPILGGVKVQQSGIGTGNLRDLLDHLSNAMPFTTAEVEAMEAGSVVRTAGGQAFNKIVDIDPVPQAGSASESGWLARFEGPSSVA